MGKRKYYKATMKLFELIILIGVDDRFEKTIDSMLDPIEEDFADNIKVLDKCRGIRKALNVPDDN